MARTLQIIERNKAEKIYRLINYIIDLVVCAFMMWFFFLGFLLYQYFVLGTTIEESYDQANISNPLIERILILLMYGLLMFVMEAATKGRSLRKLITGTKVIKTDGSELIITDLLKRNFIRAVPFDQLSFVGNKGWHDHFSDTAVVRIKNFEKAISLTTGDYIFLCDQDDVWKPEKVQKMIVNMKENPKALLLFTNGDLIDERSLNLKSTLWARWNFNISERNRWSTNVNAFQNLIFGKNYVTGATALLRRKLLKTTLPIEVPSNYYHDAWFALHAAAHNGLYFMDQCLIDYRIHKDQQVGVTSGGKNTSVMVDKKNISFEMFRKINHHKYPLIVFKIAYLQYLSKLKRKFL